jgi:RHS repeat-associated protein
MQNSSSFSQGQARFRNGFNAVYSSPFGVELKGRNFKAGSAKGYRFGFNGMEADDQIKGDGNSYDFGARMLDPRLGRWLTIDKFVVKKPFVSPYIGFADNPLMFIDPDGNDEYLSIVVIDQRTNKTYTIRKADAISNKLMAGPLQVNPDNNFELQSFHDFRTIQTTTIDKNGNQTTTTSTFALSKRYTETYLFGSIAGYTKGEIVDPSTFSLNLEGKGGSQNGGFSFYTNDGGASPTKQKSLNKVGMVDLEVLISTLTGMKGGTNETRNDIIDDVGEAIDKVVDLCDMAKKDAPKEKDILAPNSKGEVPSVCVKDEPGCLHIPASKTEAAAGDTLGGKNKCLSGGDSGGRAKPSKR